LVFGGQILRLNAPTLISAGVLRPHWGVCSVPTEPLAVFKGLTSQGREGFWERRGRERGGKEKSWMEVWKAHVFCMDHSVVIRVRKIVSSYYCISRWSNYQTTIAAADCFRPIVFR